MSLRATTPENREAPPEQNTPEYKRLIEENRIKAKARLQQAARPAPNPKKRPLEATDSTSPTAPGRRTTTYAEPSTSRALQQTTASLLRNDKKLENRIGQYVEYDLAQMKNSKGGFLLDGEEDNARQLKERQQVEELRQERLKQLEKRGALRQPGVSLDASQMPKCKHCESTDLDLKFRAIFDIDVCHKCKNDRPDEYSLLTKTECKEDYLLTDPELRDVELLPHLLRPNPHRPTYSNMMLFLRCQVEEFAFKKWGSPEALDAEFERRQAEKKARKGRKFEEKLKELRRKTRTNIWHKRVEAKHEHEFVATTNDDGASVERCELCGLEVESESFL